MREIPVGDTSSVLFQIFQVSLVLFYLPLFLMINCKAILLQKRLFHKHDDQDELFMVIKGQLLLELEDRTVVVNPGEFYTVPRGVEHKPTAKEETHLLLFEPLETKHTGDVMADITVEEYEEI